MCSTYFDIAASGHAIEIQPYSWWTIEEANLYTTKITNFVSHPNEDIHSHPKDVKETPVHTCMDGMEPTEIFEAQNSEFV